MGYAKLHTIKSASHSHPCLTIYERLVMEGEREVDRLFQFLGEPVPREAYERLKIPSVTTPSDSNLRKGKNQLSGWKEKLQPTRLTGYWM